MSDQQSRTTTDHATIRQWVESRGGHPAHVKDTGHGDDPGVLRIDFPGYSGKERLEQIPWDEWFKWFDKNHLAFVYEDRTADGAQSRFSKLVNRGDSHGSASSDHAHHDHSHHESHGHHHS